MRHSLNRRRLNSAKALAYLRPLLSRLPNRVLEAAANGMEQSARAANVRNRKMGVNRGRIVSNSPKHRRARIRWLEDYCRTATSRTARGPCTVLRDYKRKGRV